MHRRTAKLLSLASAWLALGVAGALVGPGCVLEDDAGAAPPAPECADLLVQEPCLDCLEASCCQEVRDCIDDGGDGGCAACIQGDQDACAGAPVALRLYGCLIGACTGVCGEDAPAPVCEVPGEARSGGSCVTLDGDATCNPVTNEGCDSDAGEVCDYDAGSFRCYPPPNDLGTCAACGGDAGFCGPGLSCFQQVAIGADGIVVSRSCARSCCDDADCGGGTCSGFVEAGASRVGVCLDGGGE